MNKLFLEKLNSYSYMKSMNSYKDQINLVPPQKNCSQKFF